MASDGLAVARDPDGKVVFVSGALPGETVQVEIRAQKNRYSAGRAIEVVEAAPERVAPPCPKLAAGCGGCQWQHIGLPGQRRLKAQIIEDALRRLGHLSAPPMRPTVGLDPWAYRTTMRAGVVDGRAALRAHRSNRLVDVEGCMVVHPLLAELLDGPRFDGAREVLLRCGARTGERLAVANPGPHAPRVPKDVRSDLFHEIAAGRRWRVSARSFFQARPDGVDALAALVAEAAGALAEELGGPGRAVDLYSGVGVFAGALAEAGWTVTAVEGSERAVSDAKVNLEGLDVEIAKDDVARWRPTGADLVVTDPSRDGLGRGVARVIEATGARRVVLISCDAGSLGRDAASLVSAGFRLESVTPVDLFPQTFRVEVVTVYDRAQGPTGAGG